MKIRVCFILLLSLGFASVSGNAQTQEISLKKRELISKILVATRAVENKKDALAYSLKDFDGMLSMFAMSLVKSTDSRSTQDQIKAKKAEVSRKFKERLESSVNFTDYVETNYYKLYDKFFTESELQDLLKFYETPTGQKLARSQAHFGDTEATMWAAYVGPKVDAIFDEMLADGNRGAAHSPEALSPRKRP